MKITPEGCERLANAIVRQAADDYLSVKARFHRSDDDWKNTVSGRKKKEDDLVKFFHSDWYELLTNLDGDTLIRMLDEKASKMALIYDVVEIDNKWYVCKRGCKELLSEGFRKKKSAIYEASKMQDTYISDYVRIRKRDLHK